MRTDFRRWAMSGIAIAALTVIVLAWWQLEGLSKGLFVVHEKWGTTPVTVFRMRDTAPAPVIVVAHGFAGSQQLMQPFATTLARNGYVAVSFDFPGHGRNPVPLSGGLADANAMQRDLLETLDQVTRRARGLPGSDGRLAVLGHSMAADIVVRHAHADPAVQATVAVSLFFPNPEAFHPPNLLIVDGALEPAMMIEQGYKMVGGKAEAQVTYGSFADGSARRLALARGVEHIGVLYSRDSMRETLSWLDQAFGRSGGGFLDARGVWLGLLFLGLIALARPLIEWLPRLIDPLPATATGWRWFLPVALVPALITPLLLWKVPTGFLPILLGDYLALHFALYGLLTATGLWLLQRRSQPLPPLAADPCKFGIAAILVTAYSVFAIGLPIDTYVTAFMPGTWRLPLVLALIAGTLPYFIADEWLTRRLAPLRGAYATTKLCFLLSLVIAVALNLEKLFFLVIIVPAILLLFGVYGLFSASVNRRTGHPLVAALANAVVFGWFIAVTFPVVSR
ncbi:MAG: alpha/beta hydrolase [Panacagrimonas sp.]